MRDGGTVGYLISVWLPDPTVERLREAADDRGISGYAAQLIRETLLTRAAQGAATYDQAHDDPEWELRQAGRQRLMPPGLVAALPLCPTSRVTGVTPCHGSMISRSHCPARTRAHICSISNASTTASW